ncbi:lytic transglycosylase domain-containing protein [Thermobrachium celere]|uniref:Soluble lytic murein transglycosylase n=2 Tax=Thermobrachium TaxID=150333 RepID=R7RQ11_9CLOT|nr:lytic transglycosylase domain-containing protein [Thermobrachium celere]CDF58134.1 Soluble lytic murein transglycosylase precursor [Thermobrachium celere DSM 8682]
MNKFLRILCLILLVVVAINHKFILKKIFKLSYQKQVYTYSKYYNLDPMLVFAVIKVESNFDKNAVSNKGAVGLMQIKPSTAEYISNLLKDDSFDKSKLFDPDLNIRYGCFYLKKMIEMYNGDIDVALMAYNAGCGNVNKWLDNAKGKLDIEDIPFNETKWYVKKIRKYYKLYRYIYIDIDK